MLHMYNPLAPRDLAAVSAMFVGRKFEKLNFLCIFTVKSTVFQAISLVACHFVALFLSSPVVLC